LKAQGDGPFAFANGLSATFRVETFNITKTGDMTGYFIQGSQRWQSIKLVNGKKLVIQRAGFVSSVDQSLVCHQLLAPLSYEYLLIKLKAELYAWIFRVQQLNLY
jgi:hypothetical protein